MVDVIGIEPTTSSLRTRRSPKLSYTPVNRLLPVIGNIFIIAYPKMKRKIFLVFTVGRSYGSK